MKISTVLKECKKRKVRVVTVDPGSEHTDAEVLLENGFHIQCGDEYFEMLRETEHGFVMVPAKSIGAAIDHIANFRRKMILPKGSNQ